MLQLDFTPRDVALTRFAHSPLWEVIASLRLLKDPSGHSAMRPWVTRTAPRLRALEPKLKLLSDLIPVPTRAIPAFVAPPPRLTAPDLGTELAAMRAVPASTIRDSLAVLGEPTAAIRRLHDDPQATLWELSEVIEAYWSLAIAPYWTRIRALCDSDILYRARQIAEGGMERLFGDLHDTVVWRQDRLHINTRHVDRVDRLGGRGLLLTPSVFVPRVFSVTRSGWQPTLRYPPRGVATLWWSQTKPPPRSLSAVIGSTRARILVTLDSPASTTELARRTDLTGGAVSQQLRILHRAGLVRDHRAGRFVLYARTAAAEALLDAGDLARTARFRRECFRPWSRSRFPVNPSTAVRDHATIPP